jgi:type I restriction enzyme R subunit
MGLPVDRYTEDDVQVGAEDVYRHIYRAYPALPSPFYGEEAAV